MIGTIHTPVGTLTAVVEQGALVRLGYDAPATTQSENADDITVMERLKDELAAYFREELRVFSIPLCPQGTPFRLAVWAAMREIPYGETRTYGEIARAIGQPGAARAVGAACGANPILLLQPCHRVVAQSGIGGFSVGLEKKHILMDLEHISL